MEKYGFFDAIITAGGQADRVYSADDVNNIFKGLLSDGIFRNFKNALRVSAAEGFNVAVETGKAIIKDHWYLNENIKTLEFGESHPTLSKICSVILRYDRGARSIHLVALEGTPSLAPEAPALTKNDDIFEIRLANVNIPAGSTEISAVTDTREYTTGIVDTPTVNYRRYSHVVVSAVQKDFTIPAEYELDFNTKVEVFADGGLCPEADYVIQKSSGNMQISFMHQKLRL